MNRMLAGLCAVFAFALAGCSQADKSAVKTSAKTEAAKTDKGHEHHAPHKGTLVELGEEFAHLELVLDAATGTLTAYVLDGEAEQFVRVKQAEIEITETPVTPAKAVTNIIKLKAVANTITGETVGDSSQFEGQSEMLKGLKEFDAKVVALEVKGQAFKNVPFNFPKGNE